MITIVRHAQASYGTDDYDRLSPLGHQQAAWLGAHFADHAVQFDRVIRGSLRRHRETVDGIATALDLPAVEEDPRLNELDYERLERAYTTATQTERPLSRYGFLRQFPAVFAAWGQGSLSDIPETCTAFQARVTAAMAPDLAEGHTLVVTSGGVIGMYLGAIMGLPPSSAADLILNIHNASIHRVLYEDGRLRLDQFNAVPHLERPDRTDARTYI